VDCNRFGNLEYWNTGILGKTGMLPILEYQNEPVIYKADSIPQPIIPSLHHSIIPVGLFTGIANYL